MSTNIDRLTPLFAQFSPTSQVFFGGNLCQFSGYSQAEGHCHLHLLRKGRLVIERDSSEPTVLDKPAVVLFSRPTTHQLIPDASVGADLVCARVDLGGENNPVVRAFPTQLVIYSDQVPQLESILELIFEEGFNKFAGRQPALNRLVDYFLIVLLRHVIDEKIVGHGIVAALNDLKLAKAINAIHLHPEHDWTLELLAECAGMSRSRFADHFRRETGTTAMSYVTEWRIAVAQRLLVAGKPVNSVARSVGYHSGAALAKVFTKTIGLSPTAWLKHTKTQ